MNDQVTTKLLNVNQEKGSLTNVETPKMTVLQNKLTAKIKQSNAKKLVIFFTPEWSKNRPNNKIINATKKGIKVITKAII